MRQAVVWSKGKTKLDKTDEVYIINQILMYGELEEIKDLIMGKGLAKVKEVFVYEPTKIYTPQAFNFIKNSILGIDQKLDQTKYVKALS